MPFDIVIRGGLVVDGSGMPGFQADVVVYDPATLAAGEAYLTRDSRKRG